MKIEYYRNIRPGQYNFPMWIKYKNPPDNILFEKKGIRKKYSHSRLPNSSLVIIGQQNGGKQ